jgi:hypothetical protein
MAFLPSSNHIPFYHLWNVVASFLASNAQDMRRRRMLISDIIYCRLRPSPVAISLLLGSTRNNTSKFTSKSKIMASYIPAGAIPSNVIPAGAIPTGVIPSGVIPSGVFPSDEAGLSETILGCPLVRIPFQLSWKSADTPTVILHRRREFLFGLHRSPRLCDRHTRGSMGRWLLRQLVCLWKQCL